MSDKDRNKARTARSPVFTILGLMMITAFLSGGFAAITPSYGQAQTEHFNFKVDFETSAIPACSTHEVFVSGTAHFVGKVTIGPDGEVLDAKSNVNQHAKGIDTEGHRWIFNEHSHESISSGNDFISKTHGTFVSLGQGDDFNTIIKVSFHFVIQPDGEIIIVKDEVNVQCTGEPGEP